MSPMDGRSGDGKPMRLAPRRQRHRPPLALLRRGIVTPGAVESLAHHLDGALTSIMLAQPTPRDGWNAASVWREERRKW